MCPQHCLLLSAFCRLPLLRLPNSAFRLCSSSPRFHSSAVQPCRTPFSHRLLSVFGPFIFRFSPFSPFSKNRRQRPQPLAHCPLKFRLPNSAFRLDTTSRYPTYPAPLKFTNHKKMISSRNFPTQMQTPNWSTKTRGVNAGKVFGPKPSLFSRVLPKHFLTNFQPIKKNSNLPPLFPIPHSPFPTPHSPLPPLPTPHSPLPTPHSPLTI